MNALDIVLLCMLAASVIAGFRSGLTRTAFGMLASVVGIVAGFWFYDTPAAWYKGLLGSEIAANMFGFLTVLVVVLIAGAIAGRIVSTAFKMVGLGPLDRLAGAGFGFVRGVFVAAAATTILLAATPRPVPGFMRESSVLPYALGASDFAAGLAPKALKTAVSASVREIRQAWNDEVDKAKRRAERAFEPETPAAPEPVEIVPPQPKTKSKKKLSPPGKPLKQ